MKAAVDFNSPASIRTVGVDLHASSTELLEIVADNRIADVDDLARIVADRQRIGVALARVEEFFAPIKKLAYDLHRNICAREKEIRAPLDAADAVKKTAIADFKRAEDVRRAAAERAESDARRRDDEQRALDAAADFAASGDLEMAGAIVADAIAAPLPVVVLPDVTKGVAKFRRRWCWRYIDNDAAKALRLAPREFLQWNEKQVTAFVTAMKDKARIPGIEIYSVDDPIR